MSINYTTKYSPLISARFTLQSFTDKYSGKRFDFDGARSVAVYSVDKVALGDYNRASSANRFGPVSELGDTKQVLTMSQDKSFTFAIDHGNASDQMNVKHCNEQLKSNWDEVCTPAIDKYRFNVWVSGAGTVTLGGALTKDDVIVKIMEASANMSNAIVPKKNRVLFMAESVYIKTKLSSEIKGIDTLGAEAVSNGVVGRLDGMDIVAVPDTYLPEGVQFMIKHRDATVDPMKLKTMRVQKNPVGIDGDVGECRFYHDAFALDSKLYGISVYALAVNAAATPVITLSGSSATVTCATTGATIKYTLDGASPKTGETALTYSAAVTVPAGRTIRAAAVKSGLIGSGVAEKTN